MSKTPKSQAITGIRAHWYNTLMAAFGVGSVYRQAHLLLKPQEVKRQAIEEAVRVLRKDGRIIILDLLRRNSWWGRIFGLWLHFHSYTRGNWGLIRSELQEKSFIIDKEGTVRGFVGYLLARPSQAP